MAREEYRGCEIRTNLNTNMVECPSLGLKAESIKELKTLINAELKQEPVKYERVKAVRMGWRGEDPEEVVITRPADSGYTSGVYVWVTGKGNKRSKENLSELYAIECMDKLLDSVKRVKKLKEEIDAEIESRRKLPRAKFPATGKAKP